jgi:fumarylacetoacetase
MAETYTSHFGINNIPYGIARSSKRQTPQAVTRIGDEVIFLAELSKKGPFTAVSANLSSIFAEKTLNTFAAQAKTIHVQTRAAIQEVYKSGLHKECSEDIKDVTLLLPVQVGDFTDFSVSRDHVTNAPKALFGKPQLPHTFHNFPLGYAGRCSSIYVSPTSVTRPIGQYLENGKATFGASRALDYELEVGAIVGQPLAADVDVHAKDMDKHIFGLVLVNDWSSRDIQGCEMRDPLGPFKGKNFATSMSPWVVTLEALKAFETPAPAHEEPVVQFLDDPNSTSYNLTIEAEIVRNGTTTTVCKVGFAHMYWTFRQMFAHNAIGGCPLNTGDLLASGTVSGPTESELACLMELTMNGKEPKKLSDGSDLKYLEDGDTLRFTAIAGDSSAGVGFGECVGAIKPARRF